MSEFGIMKQSRVSSLLIVENILCNHYGVRWLCQYNQMVLTSINTLKKLWRIFSVTIMLYGGCVNITKWF